MKKPYQLVKDGEWTIDKLHEMAKQATYDSDGVTGMTYKDTWGLFVNGQLRYVSVRRFGRTAFAQERGRYADHHGGPKTPSG